MIIIHIERYLKTQIENNNSNDRNSATGMILFVIYTQAHVFMPGFSMTDR